MAISINKSVTWINLQNTLKARLKDTVLLFCQKQEDRMKKTIRIASLLLTVLFLILPITAFADTGGSGNIDGGGGGMGSGNSDNKWSGGNEGAYYGSPCK